MPEGKPAFTRCIQLDAENRCMIFGRPERPAVCVDLRPQLEMCGKSNDEAFRFLHLMEIQTSPIKAIEEA